MNKDKFFIYAGTPKTASTWLFNVLDKHPEVEMPLLKELRYFHLKETVRNVSLLNRLFGKHRILKRERKKRWRHFKRRLKKVLKREPESWKYFRGLLQYFFSSWNDEWYENLFPKDKVSGDISPLYCSLSEDTIKKVKALNPNTKIIIGLRNPIEKKWSQIKMKLVRMQGKKSIEEVDKQTLVNALSHSNPNFDDYTNIIKKWGGNFLIIRCLFIIMKN